MTDEELAQGSAAWKNCYTMERVQLIETIAKARALGRAQGMEEAARICFELSLVYGTRTEGANMPEFEHYGISEHIATRCAANIQASIKSAG